MVRLTVPRGVVPSVVTTPVDALIDNPVVLPERVKVMLPVPPEGVMAKEEAVAPKVVARLLPPVKEIAGLTVNMAAVEVSVAETEYRELVMTTR